MLSSNYLIHPTAIVEDGVDIADTVKIGPYSILREGVSIGHGTEVASHVEIGFGTYIGENNYIGKGCVLGAKPQINHRKNSYSFHPVKIGNLNILREYVTVHHGSKQMTSLGSNNYLMTQVHIAHDCCVNNHVTMANGATLGGFVQVQDHAFISAHVHVHQNLTIGQLAMIGSLSFVSQDVLPFSLVSRDNTRVYGINQVGLKRLNYSEHKINQIKQWFALVFDKSISLDQRLERLILMRKVANLSELSTELEWVIQLILSSNRGLLYPKN